MFEKKNWKGTVYVEKGGGAGVSGGGKVGRVTNSQSSIFLIPLFSRFSPLIESVTTRSD